MFGLDASILYIKATVVSVCMSVCLSGQCLENSSKHCPFPVVCFVEGGVSVCVSMTVITQLTTDGPEWDFMDGMRS